MVCNLEFYVTSRFEAVLPLLLSIGQLFRIQFERFGPELDRSVQGLQVRQFLYLLLGFFDRSRLGFGIETRAEHVRKKSHQEFSIHPCMQELEINLLAILGRQTRVPVQTLQVALENGQVRWIF